MTRTRSRSSSRKMSSMSKKSSSTPKNSTSSKNTKSRNTKSITGKSSSATKPDKVDKTEKAELDLRTEAVFAHKGYKLLNKLGQGAYGQVYKAIQVSTKQYCAVKVMDLQGMTDRFKSKFLPREINTMIESKHENVIQVWDIFRSNKKIFIFMEFASNGDISGYLRKHDGIKIELACHWFAQISEGLYFLHETLRTAHRDIKLDNMLLDENFIAKLTDFGFAKESFNTESNRILMSQTFCGTLPYNCPQLIQRIPYNPFKSDCWSMGIVLFTMLHNKFPYHFRDRAAMVQEMHDYPDFIRSRYTNNDLPRSGYSLQEGLLNPDEHNRFTVRDILHNDWLRSMTKH